MTYFSKENGQWVPTGHEEYRTKLAAVKDATVSGAAYSPDVNFHRKPVREISRDNSPEDLLESPDGGLDYGRITQEIASGWGGKGAPIRLQNGDDLSGGVHIEQKHGGQLRENGFETIQGFVSAVAKNYNAVYRGKDRSFYLVDRSNKPWKTAVVKLKYVEEGDFYTVQTALLTRDTFFQKDDGQ